MCIRDRCLITKLSYHFEEGIVRADLCGQVKTIGGMEVLLESYEQEAYYQRNRRRPENRNEWPNEQQRDNRQRVNHMRANNSHRSPPNSRFQGWCRSFNNERTYNNQYRRDHDYRRPQRSRSEENQRSRSWDRRKNVPSGNQPRNDLETVTKVGETRVRSENNGPPVTASRPRADERYKPIQPRQRTNNSYTELLSKKYTNGFIGREDIGRSKTKWQHSVHQSKTTRGVDSSNDRHWCEHFLNRQNRIEQDTGV